MRFINKLLGCAMSLLLACAGNGDWHGIRETRNGIEFVQNSEKGIWQNSRELKLTSTLKIGATDPTDPTCLKSVYDVDTDPAENIYICDYLAHKIQIFDHNGKWINQITHKENPQNHLKSPSQIEIGPDGTIYVLERRETQISLFDATGKYLKSISLDDGRLFGFKVDSKNHLFISKLQLNVHEADSTNGKTAFMISELNHNGKLLNRFSKPYLIKEHKLLVNPFANSEIAILSGHNILETLHHPYILRIYDRSRKLKKVILKRTLNDVEPALIGMPGLPFEVYLLLCRQMQCQTFELPDGKLLVDFIDRGPAFIKEFNEQYQNQLFKHPLNLNESVGTNAQHCYDLFDKSGRFLQTFSIDSFSGAVIKLVDSKGNMYLRTFDDANHCFQVHRCKYKFKKRS